MGAVFVSARDSQCFAECTVCEPPIRLGPLSRPDADDWAQAHGRHHADQIPGTYVGDHEPSSRTITVMVTAEALLPVLLDPLPTALTAVLYRFGQLLIEQESLVGFIVDATVKAD